MKNIHLFPTHKPSRLFKWDNGSLELLPDNRHYGKGNYQNVYITSSEFLIQGKENLGCYYLDYKGEISKKQNSKWENTFNNEFSKKIILTTDVELINDGVQPIHNNFLEWLVMNPSCEYVDITNKNRCCGRCDGVNDLCFADKICDSHEVSGCEDCYGRRINYEIIQRTDWKDSTITLMEAYGDNPNDFPYKQHKHVPYKGKVWEPSEQETLEEAAERFSCKHYSGEGYKKDIEEAVKFGAKWQAEQNAEMFRSFIRTNHLTELWDKFIGQFKNNQNEKN